MEETQREIEMNSFQRCKDISDIKPFYQPNSLFLKPIAIINISVQFPSLRLSGNSISSKVLIESLKTWIAPEYFCSIKMIQSTVEFIRFEGEIENRTNVQAVLNRLNGKTVKIPSFPELLKIKASISKPNFPTRHDWESYFRDSKKMNERKAGERPDTLYISEIPCRWFSSKSKPDMPSEHVLSKAFEQFGEIQTLDIPCTDLYREANTSGLKKFSFNENVFDAYIQYKEYISFVKAMDSLRGMKLGKKEDKKAYIANIKITFDKTKHLSERSIQKRKIEREISIAKEKERNEKAQNVIEEEKSAKKKERENKKATVGGRKGIKRPIFEEKKENSLEKKIADEERLLIIAQRKLESIRLLTKLLKMIKESKEKKNAKKETTGTSEDKSRRKRKNSVKKADRTKEEKEMGGKHKKPRLPDLPKNISKSSEKLTENQESASIILSDSSSGDYEDHTEPLRIQETFCPGESEFYRSSVGRRESHSGRWSPTSKSYSRLSRRQYERDRNNEIDQNLLYSVTQQIYCKYLRNLSKHSQSQSKSQRSSRSRSKSKSKRLEKNSSKLKHSKKYKSKSKSPNKIAKEELKMKNLEGTEQRTPEKRPNGKSSLKQNLRKKSRWNPASESELKPVAENNLEKCSSIHTWSRSPSKDRELSWERSCESLNIKHHSEIE